MCLQLALFQFVANFLASYQHLCQSQNLAQEMQSHQSVAGSFGPELDTPRGAKRQGLRGGWQTEGTASSCRTSGAVETPSLSGFSGAQQMTGGSRAHPWSTAAPNHFTDFTDCPDQLQQ